MRISGVEDLAFVFVQKPYPVHCHGYGTEILLYLSFENIGAHLMIHFSLSNGITRAAGAPTLFLAASHLVIISRTTIVKR
jgi:hypothetical protein